MMILFVICPKVLPPLCYGTTQLQRQPPVSLARLRNQEDRGHQLVDISAFNAIMSKLPVLASYKRLATPIVGSPTKEVRFR